jgi:hypothetical protein
MSDKKEDTAEDVAIEEVWKMIDKVLPRSILSTFRKFTGIKLDSWDMAERIMGVSQKYVERKIKESKEESK